MQRRQFFAIMGSMALAGCGGGSPDGSENPSNPSPSTPSSRRSVIVIGAGMAGLAAARQLKDAGRDVIVLEARNRLGGRLFTSTHWQDAPLDIGATWIHGDGPGNPVSDLARRAGARLATTSVDNSQAYNTNGQRLDSTGAAQLASLGASIRKAITDYQETDLEAPLRDVIYRGTRYAEKNTVEQQRIDHLINTTFEHEYSGDAGSMSARWFDSDSRFDGSESLFLDGYKVLADYLATGLDVRLEHVVSAISYGRNGVKVRTNKGDITGDLVVVTLPLGVLQANRVTFDPPLPARKQQAISSLGVGVLNKCYLRFQAPFWDVQTDWINYIPSQVDKGHWAEWVSLARPTGQPILLGFNAAQFGREIEAWSDRDIVASAMSTLRTIYGNAIADPIDWQISRWASDPYAMGAYSFNKVGSTPGMRDDLASNVDRVLYFAGEATDARYFQSVHGACLSGRRAATEVLTG